MEKCRETPKLLRGERKTIEGKLLGKTRSLDSPSVELRKPTKLLHQTEYFAGWQFTSPETLHGEFSPRHQKDNLGQVDQPTGNRKYTEQNTVVRGRNLQPLRASTVGTRRTNHQQGKLYWRKKRKI